MPRKITLLLLVLLIAMVAFAQVDTQSLQSIESLIRSRNYEPALNAIKSMQSRAPRDYHLWALLGIVFSLQGNDRQALQAFDQALAISPDYQAALKGEAQLLYKTSNPRAIPVLNKILATDPTDLTAHEMLAMLQERQGECQSAIGHFQASSETVAKHPVSLEAYARCLVRTGRPEKAIPVFEQLIRLLPGRSYPKYDMALLLVQTKQYQAAIDVLDPLIAASASDPEVLSLASEAHEATGDTPKAVSLLREAIVLSPSTASYYSRFAALSLTHESFQVGIDMVDAGLRHLPQEASLYISRGLLEAQLAEYDQAEADFRKAQQLDAKQSVTALALALAQLERNKPEAAIAQVRSQLKRDPESPLLCYLLAKLLSEQESGNNKKSDEALRYARTAVKLKPDLIEGWDLLANIYLRSGQYDLAAEQSLRALKYDPADQAAIYHLIGALRHENTSQSRERIQVLVKQLSALQAASRQAETERKRFKFVEQTASTQPQ